MKVLVTTLCCIVQISLCTPSWALHRECESHATIDYVGKKPRFGSGLVTAWLPMIIRTRDGRRLDIYKAYLSGDSLERIGSICDVCFDVGKPAEFSLDSEKPIWRWVTTMKCQLGHR